MVVVNGVQRGQGTGLEACRVSPAAYRHTHWKPEACLVAPSSQTGLKPQLVRTLARCIRGCGKERPIKWVAGAGCQQCEVLTQPYKASRAECVMAGFTNRWGRPLGNCGVRAYTDTLAVPPASASFHRKVT
jgi:hypothetical protein